MEGLLEGSAFPQRLDPPSTRRTPWLWSCSCPGSTRWAGAVLLQSGDHVVGCHAPGLVGLV